RAWARSLAQQQLYEEGALALTVLKDDIQHAGFAVNANTVPALMQQAPLPVRYDASHSLLSLASYDIADCLGRQIDAQALEQPVINQYYVRTVEDRGPVQALLKGLNSPLLTNITCVLWRTVAQCKPCFAVPLMAGLGMRWNW